MDFQSLLLESAKRAREELERHDEEDSGSLDEEQPPLKRQRTGEPPAEEMVQEKPLYKMTFLNGRPESQKLDALVQAAAEAGSEMKPRSGGEVVEQLRQQGPFSRIINMLKNMF